MTELDFVINKKISLQGLTNFKFTTYPTDGIGEGVIVSTSDHIKNMDRVVLSIMNLALEDDDVYIEGYAVDIRSDEYAEFVFCKGFSEYTLHKMPPKGSSINDFEGAVKMYLQTIGWFAR